MVKPGVSMDVRKQSYIVRRSDGIWGSGHSISGIADARFRAQQCSAAFPNLRVHLYRVDDDCIPRWVVTYQAGAIWTKLPALSASA